MTSEPSSFSAANSARFSAMEVVMLIALAAVSIAVYFLPTLVAILRAHKNGCAIFMLNLLLGWTFVGWVIALVWAFAN